MLQYIILLGKAHYSDGPRVPRSGLITSSSIARMALLRKHVDLWRRLEFTSVNYIRIPMKSRKQSHELASGVLASTSGKTVTVAVLPSKLRGVSELSMRWFDVDVEPDDIALLPEEDLLVVFQL